MTVYDLRPSKLLWRFLLILHGLAAAALVVADMDSRWQIVVLAALAVSAIAFLRVKSHVRVQCDEHGRLRLWDGHSWQDASLQPDTLILPWLCILRLRPVQAGRAISVVILPDSLTPEDFRRLRVWLRWKAEIRKP